MVQIKNMSFDDIHLVGPAQCEKAFTVYTYDSFPTNFCGAGKGLGEVIVPDYIFGPFRFLKFIGLDISIKVSPACFIHDIDWDVAEPTWEAFYAANERFHKNLESIIMAKARNKYVRARALYRPVTYMNAVDIAGRSVFWTLKNSRGPIPNNARKYVRKGEQ